MNTWWCNQTAETHSVVEHDGLETHWQRIHLVQRIRHGAGYGILGGRLLDKWSCERIQGGGIELDIVTIVNHKENKLWTLLRVGRGVHTRLGRIILASSTAALVPQ